MKLNLVAILLMTVIIIYRPSQKALPADAGAASSYTDARYGFSINAPDFGNATTMVTPVIFDGPADGGFAPNVNVTVQVNQPGRAEYVQTTKARVEQKDGQINSARDLQVSGHDAEYLDYEMSLNGKRYHFLAEAVFVDTHVYLVTCTALATAFDRNAVEFKKCLDSFRLNP